jgi:hypothetical protein
MSAHLVMPVSPQNDHQQFLEPITGALHLPSSEPSCNKNYAVHDIDMDMDKGCTDYNMDEHSCIPSPWPDINAEFVGPRDQLY